MVLVLFGPAEKADVGDSGDAESIVLMALGAEDSGTDVGARMST